MCGARRSPIGAIPICICGGSAMCVIGIGIIIPAGRWVIGKPICPLLSELTGVAVALCGLAIDT